jgi:transposase
MRVSRLRSRQYSRAPAGSAAERTSCVMSWHWCQKVRNRATRAKVPETAPRDPGLVTFPGSDAPLSPDDVWEQIAPLIPQRPQSNRGRQRVFSDSAILTAATFVVVSGIPLFDLPAALGLGTSENYERRLRQLQAADTWPRLEALLSRHVGDRARRPWTFTLSVWARLPRNDGTRFHGRRLADRTDRATNP